MISANDASKRNYMMEKLSNSLENDFFMKDSITVRLPTINMLDPQTLLSWQQARRLILQLGSQWQDRMQLYFSFNLVVTAFLCSALVVVGSGFSFVDKH